MKTHVKAAYERPDSYPERSLGPHDPLDWDTPLPGYAPVEFTSARVLEKPSWADGPEPRGPFFSHEGSVRTGQDGRPLNPCGRTGIRGRGLLGRWGANQAGDPVVTRHSPETGALEMIAVYRHDCGQWAIPGGMVDAGEAIAETVSRELSEEALGLDQELQAWFRERFQAARIAYAGYSDDRRNTDNAWMETQVCHVHLDPSDLDRVRLQAGDDAARAEWRLVTPDSLASLYSNHAELVKMAVEGIPERQ